MANINLLPEEMRGKEKKELIKASKKPKVFTVNLSAAATDKPLPPVKPSKPPRSLWSEIFGKKIKPTPLPKTPTFGQRLDTLPNPKNQTIKYQEVPKKPIFQPRSNFLSSIGPAQSLVKSSPVEKIAPATPSFELSSRQAKTKVDFKYNTTPKKRGLGFFAWLQKIFARKPKKIKPIAPKKEEFHKKTTEPSTSKFVEPPKAHEKTKEKYHQAPRGEKSKLDINLIPQELLFRKYPKSRQQIVGVIMSVIIPALIITSVYLVIDQQQQNIKSKMAQLNNDKSKLVDYINGFKNIQQKNIRLQDKLLAVDKLLQQHIYWTKFFSLLERYTLDDIHYAEFTADTSGDFMLPAIASIGSGKTVEEQIADSYRKAAEQIAAFEKADDFVTQVKVNNLEVVSGDNAGVKGVKFEINLSLTDGVFVNKSAIK